MIRTMINFIFMLSWNQNFLRQLCQITTPVHKAQQRYRTLECPFSYLEGLLALETISYFLQNSYLPVFAFLTNSDKTPVSKSTTWIDSTSSALKQAPWICLLNEDTCMLAHILLCFHRNYGEQEMPFLQWLCIHFHFLLLLASKQLPKSTVRDGLYGCIAPCTP